MAFQQLLRNYSSRAGINPRSPQAIVVYSYLIAGFTLPFAGPALNSRRARDTNGRADGLGLHHCCR